MAAAANGSGGRAGAKANGEGKAPARWGVVAVDTRWQAALIGVGGVVAGLLLAFVLQGGVPGRAAAPQGALMHAAAHLRGSGAGRHSPAGGAGGSESKGAGAGAGGRGGEGKDSAARHAMADVGTSAGVDARAAAEGSKTASQPDVRSKNIHEAKNAKAPHPVTDASRRPAATVTAASTPSPASHQTQQQQAQQQQQKKQQQQAV